MSELKRVHKGLSGMYVTHYAKSANWEGYFCETGGGKMFTDSKLDGSRWEDGYLFNINDYPSSIKVFQLELNK